MVEGEPAVIPPDDAEDKSMSVSYGEPELIVETSCPWCAGRNVFRDLAPPGEREQPLFLRCCDCGRERDDLADFYVESTD